MTSDFEEFSNPDVIHYIWYDAVLDGGMNPGRPALEASTLPLGYRGGAVYLVYCLFLILTYYS